jgi:hypothetical protein
MVGNPTSYPASHLDCGFFFCEADAPEVAHLPALTGTPMAGAEGPSRQDVRAAKLSPPLQIPKNRSTGNLASIGEHADKSRYRLSYDASSAAVDYESITRFVVLLVIHHLVTPHTEPPIVTCRQALESTLLLA